MLIKAGESAKRDANSYYKVSKWGLKRLQQLHERIGKIYSGVLQIWVAWPIHHFVC